MAELQKHVVTSKAQRIVRKDSSLDNMPGWLHIRPSCWRLFASLSDGERRSRQLHLSLNLFRNIWINYEGSLPATAGKTIPYLKFRRVITPRMPVLAEALRPRC